MPCSDITETLELRLDHADQLLDLRLNKRTCGQTIGGNTLARLIVGASAERLQESTLEQLIPDVDDYSQQDAFLLYKQFFALQAALLVYAGQSAGGLADHFTLASLEYDDTGARLSGEVAVEAIVEKIEACTGCSTKKKKRPKRELPLL